MSSLREAAHKARRVMCNARDFIHLEIWNDQSDLWNPDQQVEELQQAIEELVDALDTPDSANRSTDSAEPFCNQKPVAEIVQAFADLKAVSFGGEMPPVGTKLYTAPTE